MTDNDPFRDDIADYRVTRRDVPMIVAMACIALGLVGLLWWGIA